MTHERTVHPEQWRETCDVFSLPYHRFRVAEVLGYPHAGNDVFHVKGWHEEKTVRAYVKAERQAGAAIANEINILSQLHEPIFPKVLDWGMEGRPFIVTEELPGKRLSVILDACEKKESLSYMRAYGQALGKIHRKNIDAGAQADRRFFRVPDNGVLEKLNLSWMKAFFRNSPGESATVFCHGDFHYANILWNEQKISAILDFALAGYGNRDFDITWPLIRRPGQKFMKTEEERQLFLKGYGEYGSYDDRAVLYYMAQIYCHFLRFCNSDSEYREYVRAWLRKCCDI